MNIIEITSIEGAHSVVQKSEEQYLIFKHSPRCSISNMAWDRLQRCWKGDVESLPVYLINVLTNRESSLFMASHFQIEHQSPQAILVIDSKPVYFASHNAILAEDINEAFKPSGK